MQQTSIKEYNVELKTSIGVVCHTEHCTHQQGPHEAKSIVAGNQSSGPPSVSSDTIFTPIFTPIFDPTSLTFLTPLFLLMFIFPMFLSFYVSHTHNHKTKTQLIGMVQVYLLLTPAVGLPHDHLAMDPLKQSISSWGLFI